MAASPTSRLSNRFARSFVGGSMIISYPLPVAGRGVLGVSDVAVLNWFRDKAHKLPEPKSPMPVRSMPMEPAKFMAAGLGVID
jgi:hypothetical protein